MSYFTIPTRWLATGRGSQVLTGAAWADNLMGRWGRLDDVTRAA